MRSVLIAIRHPEIRESLRHGLEEVGYITYTAEKASTALVVLQSCPEALTVLLDAQLPAEGAAERLLQGRSHNWALANHRYILCVDAALERASPAPARLACVHDLPLLSMPFTDPELLQYVLVHGRLPPSSEHISSGPLLQG